MTEKLKAKTAKKHTQKFKLLVGIAASHSSHVQFRPQLVAAVKKCVENYDYDLYVSNEYRDGWNYVVDDMNLMVDRVLAEGYDYLLFVESDVIPPAHAFKELLNDNVDVAAAVVPFHRYPENKLMDDVYKNYALAGRVENSAGFGPFSVYPLSELANKKLNSKDAVFYSGTGFILIKRRVFESGIRFINKPEVAGIDMFFYRDLRVGGFSLVLDGCVLCEHVGT